MTVLGKYPRIIILAALICAGGYACQQQRRFQDRSANRPGWRDNDSGGPGDTARGPAPRRSSNTFLVWVFRSTGDQACLERVWSSYLDELLPSGVQNWQVINDNGLRCGIGQVSDWPAVKQALERCQTGTSPKNPPTETYVGFMSPAVVRSDPTRAERNLFYRDLTGRQRGRTFTNSKLELVLVSGGRTGNGKTRVVFSPRIVTPRKAFRAVRPARRRAAKSKSIKQELENLSIVVDLGPEEFVLLGPSSHARSKYRIGSQLFVSWEHGQRNTYFILVRPGPVGQTREMTGGR